MESIEWRSIAVWVYEPPSMVLSAEFYGTCTADSTGQVTLGIHIPVVACAMCMHMTWPHACKCSVRVEQRCKVLCVLTVRLHMCSCSSSASPEDPAHMYS